MFDIGPCAYTAGRRICLPFAAARLSNLPSLQLKHGINSLLSSYLYGREAFPSKNAMTLFPKRS